MTTNGHKPIKGESDGKPDRPICGSTSQHKDNTTNWSDVQERIRESKIANPIQDDISGNDEYICHCHGHKIASGASGKSAILPEQDSNCHEINSRTQKGKEQNRK